METTAECKNCGCEFYECELDDGLCGECTSDLIEIESEVWVGEDF